MESMKKLTRKDKKEKVVKRIIFRFRLLLILMGCGFVLYGWIRSALKFGSFKTAVSVTVNESKTFLYPSVTLCPGFRGDRNILIELMDQGIENYDDILANMSYNREDFLTLFSHPSDASGPGLHNNWVSNDTMWTKTVPHIWLSGECNTYDPPFESLPGKWYGIRIGVKFPEPDGVDVFLHERGKFHYFKEDEMPSSEKLDFSHLKWKRALSM